MIHLKKMTTTVMKITTIQNQDHRLELLHTQELQLNLKRKCPPEWYVFFYFVVFLNFLREIKPN